MGKEQKATVPKEAQVMAAILKDMNVVDYEPGVINQMLEFTYRKFHKYEIFQLLIIFVICKIFLLSVICFTYEIFLYL